jgi:mRNA-degrading endonuclease RelE of RelBE toxin-antitoxin system
MAATRGIMPRRKRRTRQAAYRVEFARSVRAHLRALAAGDRAVVLGAIERQLSAQPLVETRHRKPLRPNPIAPWQLSVEDLRVFYEVGPGANGPVRILAVGRKQRNIVTIGGEEVRL